VRLRHFSDDRRWRKLAHDVGDKIAIENRYLRT
ncbi:MAG: hypothetical protein RL273_1400, partial [Bacteroidota bacterium]